MTPKFTISSYFFRNYVISFELKRPQSRHIAQIEALGLFYKNQFAKSWWKLVLVQKIGLKVRQHPQNPKNFWKIFLNVFRINWNGQKRSFLIVLRNFCPFFINLGPNKLLKTENIDFVQQKFSPLGGVRF